MEVPWSTPSQSGGVLDVPARARRHPLRAARRCHGRLRSGALAGLALAAFGLGSVLAGPACASLQELAEEPGEVAATPVASGDDYNLNAVLWVQSAVEYWGVALQAYELASIQLERALEDPRRTAALEQRQRGSELADLPPAVILDVDETVLDNSPYQARLIEDRQQFGRGSWNRWSNEAAADPVPGALEFCREAAQRGVTVFYVTNRDAVLEEATRENLRRLGFPLDEEVDTVLTRGEKAEWASSDKTPRRRHVAARYRVLLLIGDNLGDFAPADDGAVGQRAAFAREHRDFWGERWIVLPNPMYGSWEGAVIDFDYDLPRERKLARKRDALAPRR